MKTLQGIPAAQGIGIGTVVCVREPRLDWSGVRFTGEENERRRLAQALELFCSQTHALAQTARARVGAGEAEILEGQAAMARDPELLQQAQALIGAGKPAEAAIAEVCAHYAALFDGLEDELMRQRAADVRDMRTRLLRQMLGVAPPDLRDLPAGSVLVAHDLTPSMTIGLRREQVAAILTEVGGRAGHAAILARAMELPAVLGVPDLLEQAADGDTVIVDGSAGVALLHPDGALLEEYRTRKREEQLRREKLAVWRVRPTRDADGRPFSLCANIGSVKEAVGAVQAGADGVGLFRTEFLFLDRAAPPAEEEQLEVYRQAAECMAGKELIIRTLDVGGDKPAKALHMPREENPFLGCRAIRYCLRHPELFCTQLRAILRAGAKARNVKLMLPMVTGVEEVRAARELIVRCRAQLAAEGLAFDENMPVGVMIETPAAAFTADILGQEADFFSIGTNDLTQYMLAVDRGDAEVERLYTPFQPAVLRQLRFVIQTAKQAGIPVGLCGEAAADPRMIPLLLAFGLDEFSVGVAAVPAVRARIAGWTKEQAEEIARRAMACATAEEVEAYLGAACEER